MKSKMMGRKLIETEHYRGVLIKYWDGRPDGILWGIWTDLHGDDSQAFADTLAEARIDARAYVRGHLLLQQSRAEGDGLLVEVKGRYRDLP